MKQFYLIALMTFWAGVSTAQYVQFQVRVDQLYSGAPHQHTWKMQTRVGAQTNHSVTNECWGIDDTNNNRWFSNGLYNYSANQYYDGNNPDQYYRMIRTGYTQLGSLFKFVFQGYEHDEYGRCAEADSYVCGWTGWNDTQNQFVLHYNSLGSVAPGGWKQVEYSYCDGFYGVRLSYNLLPPQINNNLILMSKNGSTAETNYCQGQDIVLKVNDNAPGVIEHNDIEYVWQYNLDNDGYEDPYTCEEYDYSNCGWEATDECEVCIRRPWILNWHDAVVSSSKTASFTLPYTGSFKFRVTMRNKTTGKIGPYSLETPAVMAYSPPPVLTGLPADADLVLDNVGEKDYSSNTIEINHVTCRGASTGVISIKKIIGYGYYYYTLKKSDGSLRINVDGYTAGTPSAADPVVFPRDAFNKGALTGLPAGQYTLYIENFDDPNGTGDEQRLCFNQYEIYIKQPAANVDVSFLPVAKGSGNPYPISCNGVSDGTVSATGSGGVGPYTYSLTGFTSQNGSGTVNFTGLSNAGSYTLTASDAFSCASSGKTIQNLAQPAVLSIGSPAYEYFGDHNQYNISCHGKTGQVTLYTNGDAAMKRTVQVTNGPSDNDVINNTDPVIFALKAGSYSVVASYESGCPTDATAVTLAEPSALQASVQNTQPASCLPGKGTNDHDGYITLNVSGGIPKASGSYTNYLTISPTLTVPGTQPTFNDLSSGTYTIVIQDTYCSDTVTNLVVPVNPNPVSFRGLAQITEPLCNEDDNGKITVAGKGGIPFSTSLYEFSIEDIKKPGQFASTTFDHGITRGAYKLTIADSKGCWSDTTVLVPEPLPLVGILTVTPNTCRGDQVAQIAAALSGGTGPYSVQWVNAGNQVLKEDTVSSSSIMSALAAGTYTLRLKDSRGCTNNEPPWYELSQTITDPEVLTLSVFSFEHISCYEANDGYVSLAADGGWSSYSYSSDNISFRTSPEFEGLTPGSHTFFARDARGCPVSVIHEVEEPAVLTASLQGVKDAQCFGSSNGSVQLAIGGGTTPYYVTAGGQPWTMGTEVAGLRANTYTVSVRDENGCPQSVVATVGQPEVLVLSQVGETVSSTCGTANGAGTVNAIGGITPYEYRWFNSTGDLSASDAAAVNMLSGIYRVEVEDDNHCITPLNVAISDIGGAKIDTWDITGATCSYSLDGAVDITITEGTAPFVITWTNGQDTEDIAGVPTGDYQVRIQDANSCQLFKTFTVPAPLPLDVTIVDSQPPTCFGGSDAFVEVAFAGGNGGYDYQWASGATGTRLENLRAGDYRINLTDSKGCEYAEVITLADPDKLLLGLVDKTICVGQVHHVILPVEGGVYHWTSTNGFTSDQREVSLTQGGVYSVHVVDPKGCIADESFELATSTDLLKAELLIARKAYAGDTVIVIDISWPLPDGIAWQFDVVNTQVISQDQNMAQMIFPQPGVYPVGVEVALGDCRDTDTQFITILEGDENSGGRINTEPLVRRFDVYPNPSGGNFLINIVLRDPVPARVRMLNLAGNNNLIDHRVETQEYEYQAQLEGIPAGIYYIVLDVSGETKTKRVVIK